MINGDRSLLCRTLTDLTLKSGRKVDILLGLSYACWTCIVLQFVHLLVYGEMNKKWLVTAGVRVSVHKTQKQKIVKDEMERFMRREYSMHENSQDTWDIPCLVNQFYCIIHYQGRRPLYISEWLISRRSNQSFFTHKSHVYKFLNNFSSIGTLYYVHLYNFFLKCWIPKH